MTPPNALPPIVLITVSTERFTLCNGTVYDARERGESKLIGYLDAGYQIISQVTTPCEYCYKTRYRLRLREVAAT